MHYLIFGAGAVGSYLGARLALSGIQTTFLVRPGIAAVWKEKGLRIIGKYDDEVVSNPNVIENLRKTFPDSPPDIILLTVKTFDVASAAQEIRQTFPSSIPIVCFTNGVGSEAVLETLLARDPIIPATLTTAVQRSKDGIVLIERERGVGFASSLPLVGSIIADFKNAGMTVSQYQDAGRMKWSKLLTNIVSNASSAIIDWTPHQIFQHQDLYRVEVEALREAVRVMRSMGLRPVNLPGVPVSLLSTGIFLPHWVTRTMLGRIVSRGRGEKLPSFHYDIGRGRSEIEVLNGAVVRAGERIGIPTPTNRFLLDTMIAIVENPLEQEPLRNLPQEFLRRAIIAGVPGIQGYNP
jgi:2-dehydropantoate 2-reductase